ncbi:RNA polymerase sigma-70 factor [Echinicola marina]|uniref:RNA polymerase sigma-70 factor n=1 Tax=Echinicola marina TaxID=2859768 RepID=UPI001CF6556B|nr:RNA polymerase sigma-70 factor [Echinicola marina]UCS91872.1 RNA polymerase sigma-70 factor [Echinicola marina]
MKFEVQIEQVFRKYYPRLCAYAYNYVQDEDEVEDIVQDVFKVYLEKQGELSEDRNAIKAFLYASVRNSCLNLIRHQKVKVKHREEVFSNFKEGVDGMENIIHAEVLGKLHKAISQLPKGCALVIRMGYLEGLKNPQIAEVLNISVNTVKTQKQRGLMILREKLDTSTLMLLLVLIQNKTW